MEKVVKPRCVGEVKMVRYADDIVICCQYARDAERIKTALANRLARYGLRMNVDKTKLVNFSIRKQMQSEKQETFDFLGFVRLVWSKTNTQVLLGRLTEFVKSSDNLIIKRVKIPSYRCCRESIAPEVATSHQSSKRGETTVIYSLNENPV